MGPMTGRAAGYCAGYPVPGYMNPYGGRFGGGFGRGRGGWGRGAWAYGAGLPASGGVPPVMGAPAAPAWPGYVAPPQMTPEQESEALKGQAEFLQRQLDAINQRIEEVKGAAEK